MAICAWGDVDEGKKGRETTTGITHSLLRVVDLPAKASPRKEGRSRVSEAALRRDGINTDRSRSGPGAGP